MKTLSEIINQEPVFLNDWDGGNPINVISDFEHINMTKEEYEATESPWENKAYWVEEKANMKEAIKKYEGKTILFASYGYENYSGDAFVLVEENGELFEVHGSHCSCYGLEGQWEQEPVVLDELHNRVVNGTFGNDEYCGNQFSEELKTFLGITT